MLLTDDELGVSGSALSSDLHCYRMMGKREQSDLQQLAGTVIYLMVKKGKSGWYYLDALRGHRLYGWMKQGTYWQEKSILIRNIRSYY